MQYSTKQGLRLERAGFYLVDKLLNLGRGGRIYLDYLLERRDGVLLVARDKVRARESQQGLGIIRTFGYAPLPDGYHAVVHFGVCVDGQELGVVDCGRAPALREQRVACRPVACIIIASGIK